MHGDVALGVFRQVPGASRKLGGGQRGRQAEADHRAGQITAAQRVRGQLLDQVTVAHHPDPVGQPLYLVEVMRGEQDGGPGLAQPGDHLPGIPPGVRVEAGRRLVEEQQLRVADQGKGEVQPAQLAAGQGADPGPSLAGQAHLLDGGRHVPRPGVEAGIERDHLPHRQLGVNATGLQHDPDALAEAAAARLRIESEHLHRTGGALAVAFEDLHGRRLASAIRPEERVDLATPDLEAHAVNGAQPTVVLAQPLHHDGWRLERRHTIHTPIVGAARLSSQGHRSLDQAHRAQPPPCPLHTGVRPHPGRWAP